jgi:hypothetical protein
MPEFISMNFMMAGMAPVMSFLMMGVTWGRWTPEWLFWGVMSLGVIVGFVAAYPANSARYFADTINVGPGQRYDVIWKAQRPGK